MIRVAGGTVIRVADSAAIGTTSSVAVGVASGINRATGGGARGTYIANKRLLKGVNISGIITSLFKVKLS